jgi:hypothetical protein
MRINVLHASKNDGTVASNLRSNSWVNQTDFTYMKEMNAISLMNY